MPQPKRADAPTEEEKARIVSGPDPDRFYCPHPGCNRSFAELWRLKVHFRAPPDVRGSGKERGHGTELKFCPKCGKDLRPGKHHVGCSAGKSAPRQAAKRQRQQMSSTTESQPLTGLTTSTTEQPSGSWEIAMRRQAAAKVQRQASEADSTQRSRKAAEACRLAGQGGGLDAGELFFQAAPGAGTQQYYPGTAAAAAGPMAHDTLVHAAPAAAPGQHMAAAQQGTGMSHATSITQQWVGQQPTAGMQHAAPPGMQQAPLLDLPGGGDMSHQRAMSPSPLDFFSDPFGSSTGGGTGANGAGAAAHDALLHDDFRIPSPPPLPADWDTGPRAGMLFDFDQFDINKKQQQTGGASAPLVTVTTAMNPVDMLNPSDDYIWQILFAGENDAVPKRVTAHLHHPPLGFLDDTDPILDAILADDLPLGEQQPEPQQAHQQAAAAPVPAQQQQVAPAGQLAKANGANGSLVPIPGTTCMQQQHGTLASLDAVFQQQHQLPVNGMVGGVAGPQCLMQQGGAQQAYRNGFGAHPSDLAPAVKLEGNGVA